MTKKGLDEFCLLILNNPELQSELKNVKDVFDFTQRAVEMGEKLGFTFSINDVENRMRENRRLWHERWI